MTQPDKLYSEDQIQEWASKRADDAGRLSRQLLDTMRENERLRSLIKQVLPDWVDGQLNEAFPEHRNKHSESIKVIHE